MYTQRKHYELFWNLVRRELKGRYRGSIFGVLWAFIIPIIMLTMYTLVFGTIFNVRWNSTGISKLELAAILYCGLLLFQFFAESITQAPSLIHNNANYVKKVVFPLYILPAVSISVALIHTLIGFLVLVALIIITKNTLPVTAPLFLLVLVPLVLLTLGICWLLAAIGVYVKDLSYLIGILTSMLLFLSPIFYPVTAIPENFRQVIYLNPFSFFIEQTRNLMLWGHTLNWSSLLLYTLVCGAIACIGKIFFEKVKSGFIDVI